MTTEQGCLKIGEATCKEDDTLDLKPCCHALNQADKSVKPAANSMLTLAWRVV